MNAINKIRGFLMKDSSKGSNTNIKPMMDMKYFIIGPRNQIYVTSNMALLQYLINSSLTIDDLYANCSKYLKKISFEGKIAISDITVNKNPEKVAFYNGKFFQAKVKIKINKDRMNESSLNNSKEAEEEKLLFLMFSFDDDSILALHSFLMNYHVFTKDKAKMKQFLALKFNNFKIAPETINTETLNYKKHLENCKLKMKLIINRMQKDKEEIEKGVRLVPKEVVKDEEGAENESDKISGLVKLNNGSLYSGDVVDNKPDGNGKEFLEDGSSYVGEFRGGFWHGLGYLVDSENYICYAEFFNGRVVGI